MIINSDFRFRDDLKYDTTPIEILFHPWNGVIIRYTTLGVVEEELKDQARVRFAYDIIDSRTYSQRKLRRDKRFNDALGLILNTIMLTLGEVNEDRTDNIEEFVEE